MFELMDEMPELVYVADTETYELLYMNKAGCEMFGVDELHGQLCYKVLQGFDSPCPFCTNHLLSLDQPYTWEYTNPKAGGHYLLKDKLINWENRTVRLEIAFDITRNENEKVALQNTLDAEKVVMECIRLLYQTTEIEKTFPAVLELLGSFLSADRAYIFEIRGDKMYNTYEWCAQDVAAQMDNLQGLDTALLDRWEPYFLNHECVIIENLEEIKEVNPEEYSILSEQGISSLVAAPLEKEGEMIGYIGVDNPPVEKIRNISSLLHTLRYFLMSTIRRVEDERLLKKLSYFDMLTGLYNRNRYMRDIGTFASENIALGIVYLDINGLKDINDRYGHFYGDRVLVDCAKIITGVFAQANFYRIGGDEFIIICSGITKEKFEENIVELKKRFENAPKCQAAIGYKWTDDSSNIQKLISDADAVMYEDKKKYYRRNLSSNRYRHYNDDVLGLTAPGVLQRKLKNHSFLVYFQPKISFGSGELAGAEALIRYKMPDGSILPPDQFLPLLEEAKLIGLIDFYVFEFVCEKIAQWLSIGGKIVPVSINFSRYSLTERDFIDTISSICAKYGVDKKWVEIEMTESVEGMEGFDITGLIDRIRAAGFSVSIDDFGVHFANLSLFTAVDFDVLKIDKSLVDNITTNCKAQSVVGLLVNICSQMGIRTTAEGIETEEQFRILQQMGCAEAQGYLFSKPLPHEEYEAKFLESKNQK